MGAMEEGIAAPGNKHSDEPPPSTIEGPQTADSPKCGAASSTQSGCWKRLNFLKLCVFLPVCNGIINGMLWSANSLHFQEQGWPLERLGLYGLLSSVLRLVMTQLTSRFGPWFSLMINIIHLACLVPVMISDQEEWRVTMQFVVQVSLDAILANDAFVFFHFSESESEAAYATSAQLQSYVLGYASASTIGGIIYDLARWPGLATTHLILQASVCGVLLIEPCVHRSIKDLCRRKEDKEEAMNAVLPVSICVPEAVEPAPVAANLPGMVDTSQDHPQDDGFRNRSRFSSDNSTISVSSSKKDANAAQKSEHAQLPSDSNVFDPSTAVVTSSQVDKGRGATAKRPRFDTDQSDASQASHTSQARLSMLLAETRPPNRNSLVLIPVQTQKGKLHRDLWFPAFLLATFSFMYNCAYVGEWALFAIYFKEQHNWDSATWAGVAQSSGDILAAVILQILARVAPPSTEKEEAGFKAGGAKKLWYAISSKPYNAVWCCLWWVLLSAGMTVPNLPVVVLSQVLMGTLYVISMQTTTRLNTFYSLGDPDVFLKLQLVKLNSEAVGNAIAVVTAMVLYERVHPNAPFYVSAGMG
ncbi:unnamed protein product, partial [Symbiodinium sp. CCMP2592]